MSSPLVFPSILFITSLLTAIGYTNNQTYKISQKVEDNKESVEKNEKEIEIIKDKTEAIDDATKKIVEENENQEIIVEEVGKSNTNILRYLFISVVIILIVIIIYLIIKKRDDIKPLLVEHIPRKLGDAKDFIYEGSQPYIEIVKSGVNDGRNFLIQKGKLARTKAGQGYKVVTDKVSEYYAK